MQRILLVTGDERFGEALRLPLQEKRYAADVLSPDALGVERLSEDDTIVLDAHAAEPKGTCSAARWVRTAREQGISTPFVILTWLPYQRDIVNPQLASNPFIGHYYRDSCQFMRLPTPIERLVEVLGEIRPCRPEEIEVGKRFSDQIGHAHRPSSA